MVPVSGSGRQADEEVIVAVKYLVSLKEAVIPVQGRSGLFGTVAKEKVQPGRN